MRKHFPIKKDLYRHKINIHATKPNLSTFRCDICRKCFKTEYKQSSHICSIHNVNEATSFNYIRDITNSKYICYYCDKHFTLCSNRNEHMKGQHQSTLIEEDGVFQFHKDAFGKVYQIYRLTFLRNPLNLLERLESAVNEAFVLISIQKENAIPLKVYASLKLNFYKAENPDVVTDPTICFNTHPNIIYATTDVRDITQKMYANLVDQIDSYESCYASCWIMKSFESLDIHLIHIL